MAFLRGINLGRRNVKGPALVAAFEGLGCADVATFIASGNVVFSSSRRRGGIEEVLEHGLRVTFGYEVDTFVRTHAEVAAIAAADPFPRSKLGGTLQVLFLKKPLAAKAKRQVLELGGDRDELAVDGRELYWLTAGGISESPLDTRALGKLLTTSTARNINTIRRLAAKHPAG
jgi:uncharacterized protein (DUF1697 family)